MVQQRLQRFEETEGPQWERVEKLDSRPELETEQRTLPDRQTDSLISPGLHGFLIRDSLTASCLIHVMVFAKHCKLLSLTPGKSASNRV